MLANLNKLLMQVMGLVMCIFTFFFKFSYIVYLMVIGYLVLIILMPMFSYMTSVNPMHNAPVELPPARGGIFCGGRYYYSQVVLGSSNQPACHSALIPLHVYSDPGLSLPHPPKHRPLPSPTPKNIHHKQTTVALIYRIYH